MDNHEITRIIEFDPGPAPSLTTTIAAAMPRHPGDLHRMYGGPKVSYSRKAPKKSILKAGSKYGSLRQEEPSAMTPKVVLKPKANVQAVSDVVIERQNAAAIANANATIDEAVKKPVTQIFSRFRATRVNQ